MPRPSHLGAFVLLVLLFASAHNTTAQQEREPARAPILRIETGMHTAAITRIGVDRAGEFLVTVSDDKTARLWELPTGRLLRVLRVPISDGIEGDLFAVAIAPAGDVIAVGAVSGAGSASVYLFARESGKLLRRLTNLPSNVKYLVFSPDNALLGATLSGTDGMRVWRTSDWTEVGRDTAYGDDSYGADFDRAGRFVTASRDGFIRLYALSGGALRLVAKHKAEGGNQPYGISFSPDGSRVAVGFADSNKVAVLSGADLLLRYAPDTTGVVDGSFSGVAWSADGSNLFAGGTNYDEAKYRAEHIRSSFIRIWTEGGQGSYRDIPDVAADTIMHLLRLPDGGIVYGTYDPAIGVLDARGRRRLFLSAAVANFRDSMDRFLLSADGTGVGFNYERFNAPARFLLTDRKLDTIPTQTVNWLPPVTDAADLHVTGWVNTYKVKLNGKPLPLYEYEVAHGLALTPDKSAFLLGTDWYIRLFDKSGAERWRSRILSASTAVNVSADGRLAAATFTDGTIRWYRMTDGKELLAFFPHADRRRWVLWTPTGYYDASPGAEDLIGWHVNNGRDQPADFFPISQFRVVFYRPDVISKVLQTGDEQLALQRADEEAGRSQQAAVVLRLLPPIVEIVSPTDGAELTAGEVVVRVSIRTPSGEPVTEVRALVDGRPAAAERGLAVQANVQAGSVRELRVPMPAGESQLSIIAANRFTTSMPATVRVRARPPAVVASADDEFVIKPRLYVLAVGVSNYAKPDLRLGFPAKDARDFVAAWQRQNGALYREVVVKLLTDEQATKDEVLDGLDWIRKTTTSKDVAVILLAGHGVNDPTDGYYYLPFNANPDRLLRTGVSFSDLRNTVSAIAGKVLFFIDTCHSGNAIGPQRRGIGNDLNGVVNELISAQNGAVVFAASTGKQDSLESRVWNNGAFTKAVVEGLLGSASYDRSGKGRITINMLDLYISERVKELTSGNQTPATVKPETVPDFPVALKR